MVNQELVDYIRKYLSQGYSKQNLFDYLVKSGFSSEDVTEAFNATQSAQSGVVQPVPVQQGFGGVGSDKVVSGSGQSNTNLNNGSNVSEYTATVNKDADVNKTEGMNKKYVFVAIACFLFLVIASVVVFKSYIPFLEDTEELSEDSSSYEESSLSDDSVDDSSVNTGQVIKQQIGSFSLEESESMTDKEFVKKALDDLDNDQLLDSFECSFNAFGDIGYAMDGVMSWDGGNEEVYLKMNTGAEYQESYLVDSITYVFDSESGSWIIDDDFEWSNNLGISFFNDFLGFDDLRDNLNDVDVVNKSVVEEDGTEYYLFEFEYGDQSKGLAVDLVKFNTDLMFIESVEQNFYSLFEFEDR